MNVRPRGLYEVLLTEAIASQLRDLGDDLHAIQDGVRPAEAPDRLALLLGRIVRRAIAGVNDGDRVAVGVALARKLIEQIDQTISGSQAGSEAPIEPGTVLRAVLGRTPDGRPEAIPEPLIPLLDTTLLTNAPGEPRVGNLGHRGRPWIGGCSSMTGRRSSSSTGVAPPLPAGARE